MLLNKKKLLVYVTPGDVHVSGYLQYKNDSLGYLGFVRHGKAVYEDTKPSVQAAPTPVL